MHPRVRDLYKSFLCVAKEYPTGISDIRPKLKAAFFSNKNLHPSSAEFSQAVGRGQYVINEMIGVIQLKKYRAMKNRYETPDP